MGSFTAVGMWIVLPQEELWRCIAAARFATSTNTPTSSHDVRAAVLNSGNHNHCGTDTAGAATVDMSCADAGSFSNAILGVYLKLSVDARGMKAP